MDPANVMEFLRVKKQGSSQPAVPPFALLNNTHLHIDDLNYFAVPKDRRTYPQQSIEESSVQGEIALGQILYCSVAAIEHSIALFHLLQNRSELC
ncbi:hypothetical protein SMI01S_07600 [Sphingobacterium mizutaii NBRC 14946 = DSM 11724]|uniref:Uncharacterized protein n=1 Tax=Sphingobacterium mizutaii NBRC 14946 = DSM 11724 TaxID=1220576 RepID=A0ABQ0VZS3_9SPHI|nr:hypothetical protein SMI01S_07600 [Sphingobacterium mizutaii NBRC 14946 = DSM 11724]